MLRQLSLFATLVMLVTPSGWSMNLNYPELQVVPSAENRLSDARTDAKSSNFLMRNWQVNLPATMLIISGLSLSGDNNVNSDTYPDEKDRTSKKSDLDSNTSLQILAGLSWLGLSYYMDRKDSYGKALAKIKSLPSKSKRQRLARARYAEDALRHNYKMMKKSKWILGISTIALALSQTDLAGGSAKAISAATAVTGLVPFLFKHRYETNFINYKRYKNRIYGPVAGLGFLSDSEQKLTPSLALNFQF